MSYVFDPVRALRDMDLVDMWLAEIENNRNKELDVETDS